MYTSCHNYGLNYGDVDKGHRANGFTTDGAFCEYQVNNINTLVAIADDMSDEEGALVVTAGTAMYALTELGGLVAGESVVVSGAGPIGLMVVAVAKALGAQPVILTEMRDNRLKIALELGADFAVNISKEPDVVAAVKKLNGGKGVDYVVECSAASKAVNDAVHMVNRGGKVCLAAFTHEPAPVDIAHIVSNNIYRLRHPRRGQERGASRRGLHAAEAFRRHQDPHPHVPARRSADRDPLRQGSRRRRHQGGGEGETCTPPTRWRRSNPYRASPVELFAAAAVVIAKPAAGRAAVQQCGVAYDGKTEAARGRRAPADRARRG